MTVDERAREISAQTGIPFRIPVENVTKLKWDGMHNITFGTYSSFFYKDSIPKKYIVGVKRAYFPSSEEVGTGRNVFINPEEYVTKNLTDIYNKAHQLPNPSRPPEVGGQSFNDKVIEARKNLKGGKR